MMGSVGSSWSMHLARGSTVQGAHCIYKERTAHSPSHERSGYYTSRERAFPVHEQGDKDRDATRRLLCTLLRVYHAHAWASPSA